MRYLRRKAVVETVHAMGKRVSPSFLHALDLYVHQKVAAMCQMRDGGRKTMDGETVAAFVARLR